MLLQKNVIDADAIKEFLDSLWYPLYFMDFETTCMLLVPLYDGVRPYQPVPFQFSPNALLQHCEFLGNPDEDPQKPFLHALLATIPAGTCVLTWNQVFEKMILKNLEERFPDSHERIYSLRENIRDLMIPFKKKQIYHWQFEGSYSIKAVLPALVPEMGYDSLDICAGQMASDGWMRMVHSSSVEERQLIREQLLLYCRQDTIAMVRILEKMREAVCEKFRPD